jgi:glycosyltransferase involved in cell wall biosynthesis
MNRKSPKVTIIIPCYNYGRFLPRAVNSALNQTIQDIEVIIVDDYSTDNTPEVASRITDPRVIYIRQPSNVGQSENRNTGIRAAHADLVAFLDADDWLEPGYLELQLPAFDNPDVGVTYTVQREVDEEGKRVPFADQGQPVSGYITEDLFVRNFIGPSMIVRKSVLGSGYETNLVPAMNNIGVDWWLILKLSTKCKIVGYKEPYYNYSLHHGQISKNFKNRIESDRIIQRRFLEEHPNLISRDIKRIAKFWSFIREGFYQRESGHRWSACLSYFKACLVNPFSLVGYKGLISTIVKESSQ